MRVGGGGGGGQKGWQRGGVVGMQGEGGQKECQEGGKWVLGREGVGSVREDTTILSACQPQ